MNSIVSHEVVERGPASPGHKARDRNEDPDRELVARWHAGDLNAFESLVRRYQERVYRLLYRMLGSAADAEDASQETFLNLHRHGHRFRGDARFSTFVYRVAANTALNRRRSLGRSRARTERLAERQAAGHDLPTAPLDPDQAAFGRELRERVHAALATLPEKLRMPLVLYDIEGLPYAEVSEVLGLAEGTVKSRIHRARLALRERLTPDLEALGEDSEGILGPEGES
jgi:RNA polymerase sigma-70 factor (ECF subfamily)